MWKRIVLRAEEALAETLAISPVQDARQLRQATKTGAWLKMQPSTVNRTELGVQEWKYALFLRYSLDSPDPPNTATDVMPIYPSSMTSTAIGSASS